MSVTSSLFRVAAVQMKFAADIETNLRQIERALAAAAKDAVDAILFPECSTTGYNRDFTKISGKEIRYALDFVGNLAAKFNVNVLLGSPVFRRGRWQNCLVVFDRRGCVVHCYPKCHRAI